MIITVIPETTDATVNEESLSVTGRHKLEDGDNFVNGLRGRLSTSMIQTSSSNKMDSKFAANPVESNASTTRGVVAEAAEIPTRKLESRQPSSVAYCASGSYGSSPANGEAHLQYQYQQQQQQHAQQQKPPVAATASCCNCNCHLLQTSRDCNQLSTDGREVANSSNTTTTPPPTTFSVEQSRPPSALPTAALWPPVRRDSLGWEMRRRLPRTPPACSSGASPLSIPRSSSALMSQKQQLVGGGNTASRWLSIERRPGNGYYDEQARDLSPDRASELERDFKEQNSNRNQQPPVQQQVAGGWASAPGMRSNRHDYYHRLNHNQSKSSQLVVSTGRASLPVERESHGGHLDLEGQYYNLRVALQLPNQRYKVIIERRPQVSYARQVVGVGAVGGDDHLE